MTIAEAGEIIAFRASTLRNSGENWADLGCGAGTFTLALADQLPAGSAITAVDSDRNALRKIPADRNGVAISVLAEDLLQFIGNPALFDGILMANALHFISDQQSFVGEMKNRLRPGGCFLLVEYDMNKGSRWVPYPVPPARAEALFTGAGFSSFSPLARRPSRYGPQFLYSALLQT